MAVVPGVVLDACVLIPAALCDTLLRAARRGLFRPLWSELILAEVQRNLVRSGMVSDADKAQKRVAAMRQAFSEDRANVTGFDDIIDQMPNQAKDRHILAAAVVAGATTIVTFNLRDFKTAGTPQERIRAQHPDEFLTALATLYPGDMIEVIRAQAAALQKGGQTWTPERILDNLARQNITAFVEVARRLLESAQAGGERT